MFKRMDTNGDGVLSGDEIPERAREFMMRGDTNHDGKITQDELTKAREARRREREAQGGNHPNQ